MWNFRISVCEVFRISALENHQLNCTDKKNVTWYLSVARSGGYATVVRYTTDVEVLSQIQASERTRGYTTVLVTSYVQLTCSKRTMVPLLFQNCNIAWFKDHFMFVVRKQKSLL